ncbi:UNVERIFIED_CONTAM: cytochrome domain-containing protein [Sesamum calycinum]|uniref:Cytochrome domain-containing protein n=1 Tax=Sesamum calycinum TaxID=2727403 RepID=A0AAW2MB17_9LAMI
MTVFAISTEAGGFLRCPVGLTVLNLVPVGGSSQGHTAMESAVQSSNKYKITPQLLFEIKLHGFLLWASVGFLMPVAILIKRMSIREESGRRLRIIFYIHAITQASPSTL